MFSTHSRERQLPSLLHSESNTCHTVGDLVGENFCDFRVLVTFQEILSMKFAVYCAM